MNDKHEYNLRSRKKARISQPEEKNAGSWRDFLEPFPALPPISEPACLEGQEHDLVLNQVQRMDGTRQYTCQKCQKLVIKPIERSQTFVDPGCLEGQEHDLILNVQQFVEGSLLYTCQICDHLVCLPLLPFTTDDEYESLEDGNPTCWGCQENQANQLAHMDPGGCLYLDDEEKSDQDPDKETEKKNGQDQVDK